jgi:hypothetical protein
VDESGEIVLESMSKWCPDRMHRREDESCRAGGRQMAQTGLIRTWSLESCNNVIVVAVDQRSGG